MAKKASQKNSLKNEVMILTKEINKVFYLRNFEEFPDAETGYTNFYCDYSEDNKTYKSVKLLYFPQQLKTRIENLQLLNDEVVKVKYLGKRKSNKYDREYHAFYVEKIEKELSDKEIYEKLKSFMTEQEINERIQKIVEKMHGLINNQTALMILLKESEQQ